MKKVLTVTLASALMAASAMAEVAVNMDIASAYVFRGTTVVDDLVLQPSVEAYGFGMPAEYGSIAFGAWGSTAPFSDVYDSFHETDWYFVYALPEVVTNLDVSVGFTEYQYVVPAGEQEINFAASYTLTDALLLGGSANFMVGDNNPATEGQVYLDCFADYALDVSENFDLSVGGLVSVMIQGDGNDAAGLDNGFNDYELYANWAYAIDEMWGIGVTLQYIGQLDDNVLPDSAYDKGFVAMFSVGCDM